MKKPMNLVGCTRCGARVSVQAETCSECGYPNIPATAADAQEAGALAEYRILRSSGLAALATGLLAAAANAPNAAAVVLTMGALIFLAGVLGAWWNRRN